MECPGSCYMVTVLGDIAIGRAANWGYFCIHSAMNKDISFLFVFFVR